MYVLCGITAVPETLLGFISAIFLEKQQRSEYCYKSHKIHI